MSDDNKTTPELARLIQKAKHKIQLDDQREQYESMLTEQRLAHLKELELERERAKNEALQELLRSQAGKAQPGVATPSKTVKQHRLSDAIPIWKSLSSPALSTIEIYESAITRFEKRHPALRIETITKAHVQEYVEWMQLEGLSAKSIQKEHGAIRALINIAKAKDWVSSNPASGTMLPKIDSDKRRSYSLDELHQIFTSPVYTEGKRYKAGRGEAAYWLPILLLFTGQRREEVAALAVDDVREYNGVSYIAIIDAKDQNKKRSVPLHSELIKLGFLDFVANQKQKKRRQLFHLLEKTGDRKHWGTEWGKWWNRYIRGNVGIKDKTIGPAHSFRHLFISECRRLEFREDYERALVGHTKGQSRQDVHDSYGEHYVPALADAVNRIDFHGLDLSHLHPEN